MPMNPVARQIMEAVCTEHLTWHALEKKITSAGVGIHGFSEALGWLARHKLIHQVGHVEDDGSRWTTYAPTFTAWTRADGRPAEVVYSPRLCGYTRAAGMCEEGARPVPWTEVYASEAEAVRAGGA